MYAMHVIGLLCLLLFLNEIESFKLTRNASKVIKGKISPRLGNEQPSITRQSHTCLSNCNFALSFNESLVLPVECVPIETNGTCEMTSTIDYTNKEISFFSFDSAEGLTVDNITYDSSTIHVAYFQFSDKSMYHVFSYACAIGGGCEWKSMQEMIPKLIKLDYQVLFNSLLPLIYNSSGHPDIAKCYDNTTLMNCPNGFCWFLQSADKDYNLEILRSCAVSEETYIEIGRSRHIPGPATHDYDIIAFTCDNDECNGEANEDIIKHIVSSNGNEYISSSGTRFQLTSYNLFFISLLLLNI